ncbi:hypothetical protein JRC04_05150 [Mycolicibacterium sp. S2-37]|uniref:hypothetical protein n=1 Tax=Mycolicibacterium sp. S2-37 TaxID=2810297 RepID=UPI001A953601|nr:hypothetical protein [Mycolicibacterium sp. S2-37]MBO0676844.1 hypothetical protein [Mycolicibacterium sp. S2-37]
MDGLPDKAVVLNQLHVVEYMAEDGQIYHTDISKGSDGLDLELGKVLELAEWVKAMNLSPMYIEMVHDYITEEGDEDDDDE